MIRVRQVLRRLAVVVCIGAAWPAAAADAQRGRALYDGREPLTLASRAGDNAQACASCHRPSGMGGFEGGLAVPPIAAPQLFSALDRDTARFFRTDARYRVRPAYDEAGLGRLLRTGVSPDGVTMHAAMPRVRIDDAQLADLSAYLRGLSATPAPGIDRDHVLLATVSTPDADPLRRDAMLATLEHFIEQKNGQSRHEAQRSRQASHTREMVMYTKFRVWHLVHWALEGPPSTWGAQLAERQAREPVFAMVAGIGRAEWGPVAAFCETQAMPCLLPLVDAGGAGNAGPEGFYGLYYHAGIDADARLAALTLRADGVSEVTMWFDDATAALAARVAAVLRREGLHVDESTEGAAVVSVLAPAEHVNALRTRDLQGAPVLWLAGSHGIGQAEAAAAAQGLARGWIVTPMRSGAELDRQLQRTRLWMQQQGLRGLPPDVVASTLQAATVLGEGLMHLDFAFTREYLLELLEHGLENVIPWSPYPRLSIGPGQRIAVKSSRLGEVRDGQTEWREVPVR